MYNERMKRWEKIIVTILLALGTSVFFQLFPSLSKTKPPNRKIPPAITREATTTGVISITGEEEQTLVKRVIDGDTIELSDGRKVRYIGINSSETVDPRKPVECFGKEAKVENKRLTEGKIVRLEKDISQHDKYGRLLRYIYVGDVMVNEYLVRQGFAHAATYPPDVKYAEKFKEAETEARENNRGLWSNCSIETK